MFSLLIAGIKVILKTICCLHLLTHDIRELRSSNSNSPAAMNSRKGRGLQTKPVNRIASLDCAEKLSSLYQPVHAPSSTRYLILHRLIFMIGSFISLFIWFSEEIRYLFDKSKSATSIEWLSV